MDLLTEAGGAAAGLATPGGRTDLAGSGAGAAADSGYGYDEARLVQLVDSVRQDYERQFAQREAEMESQHRSELESYKGQVRCLGGGQTAEQGLHARLTRVAVWVSDPLCFPTLVDRQVERWRSRCDELHEQLTELANSAAEAEAALRTQLHQVEREAGEESRRLKLEASKLEAQLAGAEAARKELLRDAGFLSSVPTDVAAPPGQSGLVADLTSKLAACEARLLASERQAETQRTNYQAQLSSIQEECESLRATVEKERQERGRIVSSLRYGAQLLLSARHIGDEAEILSALQEQYSKAVLALSLFPLIIRRETVAGLKQVGGEEERLRLELNRAQEALQAAQSRHQQYEYKYREKREQASSGRRCPGWSELSGLEEAPQCRGLCPRLLARYRAALGAQRLDALPEEPSTWPLSPTLCRRSSRPRVSTGRCKRSWSGGLLMPSPGAAAWSRSSRGFGGSCTTSCPASKASSAAAVASRPTSRPGSRPPSSVPRQRCPPAPPRS